MVKNIDNLEFENLFLNILNSDKIYNNLDFNQELLFFLGLLQYIIKKAKDEEYKKKFNFFPNFPIEKLKKKFYPQNFSDYLSIVSFSIYSYFNHISKNSTSKDLILSIPDFTTSNIRNLIEKACNFYDLKLKQIYNNYICLALSILIENKIRSDKNSNNNNSNNESDNESDNDSYSDDDDDDEEQIIIMIYFGKFYLDISYFVFNYSKSQIRLECYYKRRFENIGAIDIYLIIFNMFLNENIIDINSLNENEIKEIFILINKSFDNYINKNEFKLTYKKDNKEYNFSINKKNESTILEPYLINYLKPIINDLIELVLIENDQEIDKINYCLNVGEMFEIPFVKNIFENDYILNTKSDFFDISLQNLTYKQHINNSLKYIEISSYNNVNIEISDVCAQNISFKLIGNKCSTIIGKNSNYDKLVSKDFFLLDLKKDCFNLLLYEGNYLEADKNYFINNYKISGYNIEKKNEDDEIVIKVNFNLNKNGVLINEAFEMGENNKNENKKLFIINEFDVDLEQDKKLSIKSTNK